jgi:hypothetical protein
LEEIRLFPNPASNMVMLSGIKEEVTIEIMNALGEKVMSLNTREHQIEIPIQTLPLGNYYISIENRNARRIIPFARVK